MDNELGNERTKSIPIITIILIAVIIGLAALCIDRQNRLQSYRDNTISAAWQYCEWRSGILSKYAAVIFPKYKHLVSGGIQDYDTDKYTYEFQSSFDPERTLQFVLPIFKSYWVYSDDMQKGIEADGVGIDFTKLGVLEQDLQQQNMPELEDDTKYMLTASLSKEYLPGKALNEWESQGYVRLDDFREDTYYDSHYVNLTGPTSPDKDKYQVHDMLDIWYGLATLNSEGDYLVYGIDEDTAYGCISAEQMAVEYFHSMSEELIFFHPINSMSINEAAYHVEFNGGYVRCLLLTGSGADIKDFIAYANAAGYIVEPLQVLDSI